MWPYAIAYPQAGENSPEQAREAGVSIHNAINHAHWPQRLTSEDDDLPWADVRKAIDEIGFAGLESIVLRCYHFRKDIVISVTAQLLTACVTRLLDPERTTV